MTFITRTIEETEKLGRQIGTGIKSRYLVTLDGELGAGKTCLVRGLVQGLGSKDIVTSPTFALVNEYASSHLPIYHFDMYRIHSIYDLESTGFFDYLGSEAVLLVEWSLRIANFLPNPQLRIFFKTVEKNERKLTIEGNISLMERL
ncbi:MAG: tRNA (adenosine(37)-N6)-threonylcarbamoyltransferase complex ATPase subunit type 1 TsaE [Oscillospiraceae bacterium]|nr:tRNA (adenosine(37)-N6)-threonylcarbamoyltransferase complex ATPase subunit type 1 TsaE [Oscillospiraceae bacterium]